MPSSYPQQQYAGLVVSVSLFIVYAVTLLRLTASVSLLAGSIQSGKQLAVVK